MGSGPGPRLAECLLRYIWAMNWAQPGQGTPSGHGPGGDGWSNPTARFDAAAAGDGFGAGPELELVTPNRPPVMWLGIALLLGIDQFLDMGRSATNVVGNSVATSVITKWEGMLEKPEPPELELPPPHPAAVRTVSPRRTAAASFFIINSPFQ